MKYGSWVAVVGVAIAVLTAVASAGNNHPIVLWHGFAGFGRDNFLLPSGKNALYYWGFLQGDLQSYLIEQGFEVHTVSVGPVSSSWDRACEAFAQIKGGTVDFGLYHSSKHGHERYQRTYQGLVPDIGTVDPATGEVKKIHIIAHSMGGKDAKLFASLLLNGDQNEIRATGDGTSMFFTGNHPWIASITTISSPHDGTTLASSVQVFFPWLKNLLVALVGLAGLTPIDVFYDFKLDQWGLAPKEKEKFEDYVDRVLSSEIWTNNADISLYDLSPEGSKLINEERALINIPYFSYETEATYKGIGVPFHYPDLTMFFALWPTATLLGAFTRSGFGGLVPIDSTWYPNDGIVNSRSMRGPTLGLPTAPIINYDGKNVYRGVFNYLGKIDHVDHLAVVGAGILFQTRPFFKDLAKFLAALTIPAAETSLIVGSASPEIPEKVSASSDSPTTDSCKQYQEYQLMCGPDAIYSPLNIDTCMQLASQLKYCADSTPSTLNTGSIIAIVTVVVVVLVGISLIVVVYKKRAAKTAAEYQPINSA